MKRLKKVHYLSFFTLLILMVVTVWSISLKDNSTLIPIPNDHLINLIKVNSTIYSGAEPDGHQAFAELQKLGIKTIISVDGAKPDITNAEKNGLKYIHVPIGYDGVPKKAQASIARALDEYPSPFYIHCHHGKHRGPAAAAIAWSINGEIPPVETEALLVLAQTSKRYKKLWKDARNFSADKIKEIKVELHSVAPVETLAAEMAKVDRTWDNLKLIRKSKWLPSNKHPDISPQNESLILYELFFEINRLKKEPRKPDYYQLMQETLDNAKNLNEAIESKQFSNAEQHYRAIKRNCFNCHLKYRN